MDVSRRKAMKKESHFTRCWLGHGGRQLGIRWERLGRSLLKIGDSSKETRETLILVSPASVKSSLR